LRKPIQRFQTHLPVLEALPKWRPVSTVVELGGGVASTALFRDPAVYPDIRLVTWETDPQWASYLEKAADERCQVRRTPWMSDAVLELEEGLGGDLLFVDCDPEGARNLALRRLADKYSVVVLHDAEREDYRLAQLMYRNRVVYDALTPHTAILSNTVDLTGLAALLRTAPLAYRVAA